MIKVGYTREFVRLYRKLSSERQEEVKQAVALFQNRKNHGFIAVHKLHGKQVGRWSFSINFRDRIIFEYIGKGKNHVALLQVGDHNIYE